MEKKAITMKLKSPVVLLKRSSLGAYRPGSYYSTIPDKAEVAAGLANLSLPTEMPDIELRREQQLELLQQFERGNRAATFPEEMTAGHRFYHQQNWFSYNDAIMLSHYLQHFKPRRIVEVGSGFSSAAMLDTLDACNLECDSIDFVEPYPKRLYSVLSEHDRKRARVHEERLQTADLELFRNLQADDLLFIDSSHVLKFGSDLHYLLFQILPILQTGVHVHFHDIFFPFEYPSEWHLQGRFWNECYLLRAFLSGNQSWQIELFNHYASLEFGPYLEEAFPGCRQSYGGSLYIRRVA